MSEQTHQLYCNLFIHSYSVFIETKIED